MIVKNISKENNTVSFQVELSGAEFEEHVAAAYRKNRGRIQVPGFRKGKASRMVVEGFYGKDVFYEDAIEDAASPAFVFAVEQEKLRVVGRPSVTATEITDEKGALLTFGTDVWPEATLGEYKGLEAEKDPTDVSDEEIDREIERLRKQNARMISVDRPAENGDTVNIDYAGTKDGVAFDGGTAEGHDLVLGSGSFIPGFEEKLVGISAGEERDLDLTFPENYHAKDLAGLKAQKGKFSEMALADIEVLATAVRNILELAEKAVTTLEYADARKIEPLEEVVDALTEELRSRHIQRMTRGDCDVYSGIQYDNILSNMERIADQCSDLGLAVIALTKSSIFGQEHQYIQDVHRDLDQKEHEMYQKEYERYFGILDKNDRMKQEA